MNPDLPPEEGPSSAVGSVKEFIYLLEDLSPDQVQGLAWRNSACRSNCVCYDLKEGQIEQQRPGLMRRPRFLYPSADRYPLAGAPQAMDALRERGSAATGRRILD